MRYLDFYLNDKTAVAFDCIQTGEVVLKRTPNVKRFVMTDGTPCIYPAQKDAATMTLQLECNSADASAIARSARYGSLVIAGMSWGTNRRPHPQKTAAYLPEQSGIPCYITGAVTVTEISACADLYSISMPLQLLLDASGEPERTDAPAVKIGSLYIDDVPEQLENYHYQPVGTFVRRGVIGYDFPEIPVRCEASVPDGGAILTTVDRDSETLLTGGEMLGGMLPLRPGRNDFLLTVQQADGKNGKPQYVKFSVLRDDATDGMCALRLLDGSYVTTGDGGFLTVKEENNEEL